MSRISFSGGGGGGATGGGGGGSFGGNSYRRNRGTFVPVGGLEVGYLPISTVQNLLDDMLYPFQLPEFTEFFITGQAEILEWGQASTGGSLEFYWNTSHAENVIDGSVVLEFLDEMAPAPAWELLAGGMSSEGQLFVSRDIYQYNQNAQISYRITGTNTRGDTFSRLIQIKWRPRIFWGAWPNKTPQPSNLPLNELREDQRGTYLISPPGHKVIAYPVALGPQDFVDIRDPQTGLQVAMDNATVLPITNDFGLDLDYYVYPSFYFLNGPLTLLLE